MKKTLSLILCLAMLVSTFSFVMPIFAIELDGAEAVATMPVEEATEETASLAATNLWQRGDFEDYDVGNLPVDAYYYVKGGAATWQIPVAEDTETSQGKYLRVRYEGGQFWVSNATSMALDVSKEHKLTMKVRVVDAANPSTITLTYNAAAPNDPWNNSALTSFEVTSAEWTEVTYTIPVNTPANFIVFQTSSNADTHIDDICIEEVASAEEEPTVNNLWQRGDFTAYAAGNLPVDAYYTVQGGAATWQISVLEDTETSQGKYLRVRCDGGQFWVSNATSMALDVSKEHKLSMKVKVADAAVPSKITLTYNANGPDAPWNNSALTSFEVTSAEWTEVTYTIPVDTPANYIIFQASSAAHVMVDDICIEEVVSEEEEPTVNNLWQRGDFTAYAAGNLPVDAYYTVQGGAATWQISILEDTETSQGKYLRVRCDGGQFWASNNYAIEYENGVDHIFSMKVKVADAAVPSKITLTYNANKPDAPWNNSALTSFDVTSAEWTEVTYTIPAGTPANYIVFQASSAAHVMIDDISIVAKGIEGPIPTEVSLAYPTVGAVPQTTIENAFYTATVDWSPAVDGTFAPSTKYTATIEITLANDKVTLAEGENCYTFATATGTPIYGVNADGSNVITVEYPATIAAKPAHTLVNKNILKADGTPVTFETDANVFTANSGWSYGLIDDAYQAGNKYARLRGWAGFHGATVSIEAGRPVQAQLVYNADNGYSSGGYGLSIVANGGDAQANRVAGYFIETYNQWLYEAIDFVCEDEITSLGLWATGGYDNTVTPALWDHTYIDSISFTPYDKVTFYVDGEVFATEYYLTDTITFEDAPAPSKDGYMFAGWALQPTDAQAVASLEATSEIEDFELHALFTEGEFFATDASYRGVRNDKYASGIRVKSVFDTVYLNNMTEYGFVVADTYMSTQNGEELSDIMLADSTLSTVFTVKLYEGEGEKKLFSKNDTECEIAVLLDYTDVDLVNVATYYEVSVRPYAKVNGITQYGSVVTYTFEDYIMETMEDSSYVNFAFTKEYVDAKMAELGL